MFSTKKILTAAALALVSFAGISAANAGPWERHEMRRDVRVERQIEHRAYVDRIHVADALRLHRYRVIGDPYFVHGRYVVRTHDRFGRVVFVQVNPYSGTFVREVVL